MRLKIFAMDGTREFGERVAQRLGVPLGDHEEYCFDDGECYVAPRTGVRENVRGCDVFVVSSMYSDDRESVNDKVMKTLIFCGALRDASAERITLVSPYYPYTRQDRKTTSRAPITTKYMAGLFTRMFVDRLLCIDVHNPTAIQNAYDIPCDILEANSLFAHYVFKTLTEGRADTRNLTILSPDAGGLGRGRKFRKILSDMLRAEVGLACVDKVRVSGREAHAHGIMGNVDGRDVIVYDDMFASGKSTVECVDSCLAAKSRSIFGACATHGLFVGNANRYFLKEELPRVVVTDTIRPFRLQPSLIADKLVIIDTSRLFAEAIARIHKNESISDLLNSHPD